MILKNMFPYLGFGLGLRTNHYHTILTERPTVDWFEILTENYLVPGGRPLYYLDKIREHYPLVMHGVSLSIGSTDPLNFDYLAKVKALAKRIEPKWISDHLCWTGVNGVNLHDLMPLPYTQESIDHVAARVLAVQDYLGRQILLENVSSYVAYTASHLQEWEFISAIAEKADCMILLDVNNIYVSSFNHGFNPIDYINAVPKHRVKQIHLAGHLNKGNYIIDTHDHTIIDPVWDLYKKTLQRLGPVSTMIERDDHIPELPLLLKELALAKNIAREITHEYA
ncbi:MAG: hypothetical protein A3I12_07585 [Gammaproteobacteria bacterium RIFCSPLOWO2_02_FULL_38_11]|nr:MAG: hypothetical protein A3B69_05690 [Gammaproteobacteria bacterium RIFCSPHIGHO2_02_FULL_38_33]OGT24447.1 MAG: hypothetical protein A2W47_05135 [Gammaproteobacteria bacterium RIFCSPHIGHO2_12_38_15]OGT68406.1 MAG: hypothetical protein A3I12_07585 [Gammaproteobacteria bacterium RIFCSPLOWO2_02_FULL_38_11]OGT77430.1 MAG: hypothetical protein A3G71_01135 [Gammaproteobacteria bacterium RIFCSPLOWO2_12_FULL_38_14]